MIRNLTVASPSLLVTYLLLKMTAVGRQLTQTKPASNSLDLTQSCRFNKSDKSQFGNQYALENRGRISPCSIALSK